jgi:hypothetical protein
VLLQLNVAYFFPRWVFSSRSLKPPHACMHASTFPLPPLSPSPLHTPVHLCMCSIPVLVLQTLFNDRMDRRLGLPLAALTRFMVGLGSLALIMSYFPLLTPTHTGLLVSTGEKGEARRKSMCVW